MRLKNTQNFPGGGGSPYQNFPTRMVFEGKNQGQVSREIGIIYAFHANGTNTSAERCGFQFAVHNGYSGALANCAEMVPCTNNNAGGIITQGLLVGINPSNTTFPTAGNITIQSGGNITFGDGSTLSSSTDVQFDSFGVGTAASGTTGEIRATNDVTAFYSSDINLKENIEVIADPLGKINAIRGVLFDWTDEHIEKRGGEDGYFVQKHDVGVIAQEVEAVLPEVVRERDDGTKAVDYQKIVPLLIEGMKEQQKQIDDLKGMVQDLLDNK